MASTLLTPSIIAKESLMQLDNNLVAAKMVYRAYESEFGETKIGDTLTIRRPVKYAVRTGSVAQMQDATEGKVQLQINTQRGVDLRFPTKDLTLTIDRFAERYLKHPMIALANQVDLDILSMHKYVWNWVGTPGQTLSGYKSFIKGPQRLDEMGVPAPRAACLSPADFYGIASSFTSLFVPDVARTALEKSKLPMVGNTDCYSSQNVINYTVGSYARHARHLCDRVRKRHHEHGRDHLPRIDEFEPDFDPRGRLDGGRDPEPGRCLHDCGCLCRQSGHEAVSALPAAIRGERACHSDRQRQTPSRSRLRSSCPASIKP